MIGLDGFVPGEKPQSCDLGKNVGCDEDVVDASRAGFARVALELWMGKRVLEMSISNELFEVRLVDCVVGIHADDHFKSATIKCVELLKEIGQDDFLGVCREDARAVESAVLLVEGGGGTCLGGA